MATELINNPFPEEDPDRHEIWEMLVGRSIRARCRQDWELIAADFQVEGFMGMDAGGLVNPDSWRLRFADWQDYRDHWHHEAGLYAGSEAGAALEAALLRITTLRDIEINGDRAIARRKQDGYLPQQGGGSRRINTQSLFHCIRQKNGWKIAGCILNLPHPMGHEVSRAVPSKRIPPGATQHVTAGPYSPVLLIKPGELAVISGQAAIDKSGRVIGDTIEEQTHLTLQNCASQLAQAGLGLRDVFKVNVYLTDLDNWPLFNEVYKTYFESPLPVRTAVQTPLLLTLLVEVEMWAVKS